jgi:hypothetical protein
MIVFGLGADDRPRVALVTSAVLWPVVPVAGDVVGFEPGLLTASALARRHSSAQGETAERPLNSGSVVGAEGLEPPTPCL